MGVCCSCNKSQEDVHEPLAAFNLTNATFAMPKAPSLSVVLAFRPKTKKHRAPVVEVKTHYGFTDRASNADSDARLGIYLVSEKQQSSSVQLQGEFKKFTIHVEGTSLYIEGFGKRPLPVYCNSKCIGRIQLSECRKLYSITTRDENRTAVELVEPLGVRKLVVGELQTGRYLDHRLWRSLGPIPRGRMTEGTQKPKATSTPKTPQASKAKT